MEFSIEVTFPYLLFLFFGAISFIITCFDRIIRNKLYLNAPLIMTIVGIIVREIVDHTTAFEIHDHWLKTRTLLEDFTAVVICVQLMATALDLPTAFWRDGWVFRSLVALLGPCMVLTWWICAALLYAIFHSSHSFSVCLLIAAAITPTDPVLAHAVVKGRFADKHIPQHIRDVLSAESSFNDGTAYPFVLLGILLLSPSFPSAGSITAQWIVVTWLYEIGVCVLIGVVIGYVFGVLHGWCYHHHLLSRTTTIPLPFFLAIFVLGACTLCGTNGILGTFVAGIVFALEDSTKEKIEQAKLQDTADTMFGCIFFIIFGAFIPFDDMSRYLSIGQFFAVIVAIHTLKRLPLLLILKPLFPAGATWSDQFFLGWFGPVGVAAWFYAMFVSRQLERAYMHESESESGSGSGSASDYSDTSRFITSVISLVILASVVLHAITSVPFTLFLTHGFSTAKQTQTQTQTQTPTHQTQQQQQHSTNPQNIYHTHPHADKHQHQDNGDGDGDGGVGPGSGVSSRDHTRAGSSSEVDHAHAPDFSV